MEIVGASVHARATFRLRHGMISQIMDREVVFDLLAGPIYWRLFITRHPYAPDYVDQLVAATVEGLRALSRLAEAGSSR